VNSKAKVAKCLATCVRVWIEGWSGSIDFTMMLMDYFNVILG